MSNILLAIENGSLGLVEEIIKKHPERSLKKDVWKNNLVQYAIDNNQSHIVLYLLENHKEIDVNSKNIFGYNALHMSCLNNCSSNLMEKLIEAGADVKIQSRSGKIALHYVSKHKLNSKEKAEILIEAGSPINPKDKSGKTPLNYSVEAYDVYGAKTLIEYGAILGDLTIDNHKSFKVRLLEEKSTNNKRQLDFPDESPIKRYKQISSTTRQL